MARPCRVPYLSRLSGNAARQAVHSRRGQRGIGSAAAAAAQAQRIQPGSASNPSSTARRPRAPIQWPRTAHVCRPTQSLNSPDTFTTWNENLVSGPHVSTLPSRDGTICSKPGRLHNRFRILLPPRSTDCANIGCSPWRLACADGSGPWDSLPRHLPRPGLTMARATLSLLPRALADLSQLDRGV